MHLFNYIEDIYLEYENKNKILITYDIINLTTFFKILFYKVLSLI